MTDSVQKSFRISGMSCASCVGRVETALADLPDVLEASVNLATETATVRLKTPEATSAVTQALDKAGYPAVAENVMSNEPVPDAVKPVPSAIMMSPVLLVKVTCGAATSTSVRRRSPSVVTDNP